MDLILIIILFRVAVIYVLRKFHNETMEKAKKISGVNVALKFKINNGGGETVLPKDDLMVK